MTLIKPQKRIILFCYTLLDFDLKHKKDFWSLIMHTIFHLHLYESKSKSRQVQVLKQCLCEIIIVINSRQNKFIVFFFKYIFNCNNKSCIASIQLIEDSLYTNPVNAFCYERYSLSCDDILIKEIIIMLIEDFVWDGL